MHCDPSVSFRPAKALDEVRLKELMRELIDELGPHEHIQKLFARMDVDVSEALIDPDITFFIAEREGNVVALVRADVLRTDPLFRLRDDHRCGYIDQMYVSPGSREQGIGEHLMLLAERWFLAAGIRHVMLHSAPKAARLYARLGYQPNRQMFKTLS